jgi:hypothetical protein
MGWFDDLRATKGKWGTSGIWVATGREVVTSVECIEGCVSQRQKSKIGQMQTPGAENAMLKKRGSWLYR